MAGRIRLVQGSTPPQLIVSLTDSGTGLPVSVAAPASTVMKVRQSGTTAILFTMTGTPLTGAQTPDGQIDTTYSTLGSGGRVAFSWPLGPLTLAPGDYEGEISLTTASGDLRTVYQQVKFSVRASF